MEPNQSVFSDMDRDAIGEILNISLGSSATSVSGLLDKRVTITTPSVSVVTSSDFTFSSLEPAVAVEINYISGLSGTNVMILKESDVKSIVGLLMGVDYSEPGNEFQMDEMSISAICEVMNQMMGASSTALSQFLGRTVNISTPVSFLIEDVEEFKRKYYNDSEEIVAVSFNLEIEDKVNSEFISVFTIGLAKELIDMFGAEMAADPEPEPEPVVIPPQPVQPTVQQVAPPPQPAVQASQMVEQPKRAPQPRPATRSANNSYVDANLQAPEYDNFDEEVILNNNENYNLGMIMNIPLEITVEIGRTKKKIKDILDFTTGTIIELSKQAGTPVDIFVNGKPIAKGDVVVVDDYYGVRITEVSSNSEILDIL
ncbi:MAG: flagellar motor switch phosphatase FliY [Oscillospiraceae bacterium]